MHSLTIPKGHTPWQDVGTIRSGTAKTVLPPPPACFSSLSSILPETSIALQLGRLPGTLHQGGITQLEIKLLPEEVSTYFFPPWANSLTPALQTLMNTRLATESSEINRWKDELVIQVR